MIRILKCRSAKGDYDQRKVLFAVKMVQAQSTATSTAY